MARHIVLMGLPGAGKTTVGRLVAEALGTWFVDLDEEVTRLAGAAIPEIFATRGESAFRDLERQAMVAAVERKPGVIATGGGWAAQPGNLEAVRAKTFSLYLNTGLQAAARRTAGTDHRPLLEGDREAALSRLLEARKRYYRQADETVDTDHRTAEEVGAEVVALARATGGW